VAVPAAPALTAVESTQSPVDHAAKEMYRWMLWFGLPVLGAAVFVGAVFATGAVWLIAPAICMILLDIMVLAWLCLSSDTNGLIGEPPAH
jgi:hypothetical protein